MMAKAPVEGGQLGRYVLLAPTPGADGQDHWLARDTLLGANAAPVLVRHVPEALLRDPARLAAVREEASLAAGWEHPHLLRLIELAQDDDASLLVTEFVPGRSLRQILTRAGSLQRVPPIWFTLHVAGRVCEALAFLHARGAELATTLSALRLPVTPEGVVVSFAGDPKLCVLGLGLPCAEPLASATLPLNRTFAYVAPERLAGKPTTAADVMRADVYSLGVVLYEALTGRRPFEAETEENLLREVLDERREPVPPGIVAPWVVQPLEELVLTAIARDPESRFCSAAELGEAIAEYMAWAGLRPLRKHVAQQICGFVPHADSAPPPSARSSPSGQLRGMRPSIPPAIIKSELGARDDATVSAQNPGPGAPTPSPSQHAWDRATAAARRDTSSQRVDADGGGPAPEAADASPPSDAPAPGAPGSPAVHFWDRVVQERSGTATAANATGAIAVDAFEAGLALGRAGQFAEALTKLEEALRLDPENRVYGANLRRVQRELERQSRGT